MLANDSSDSSVFIALMLYSMLYSGLTFSTTNGTKIDGPDLCNVCMLCVS